MELKFDVTGMTCAACSARVEKVVAQVPDVQKAEVNLLAGSMVVFSDDLSVTDAIIQAVQAAGYGATLAGQNKKQEDRKNDNGLAEMKKRILGSAIFHYGTHGGTSGSALVSWSGKCVGCSTSSIFLDTASGIFESGVLYTRFKSTVEQSSEHGLVDCGWLRRGTGIRCFCAVSHGLCYGTRRLEYSRLI